jgi:hypothetical protein
VVNKLRHDLEKQQNKFADASKAAELADRRVRPPANSIPDDASYGGGGGGGSNGGSFQGAGQGQGQGGGGGGDDGAFVHRDQVQHKFQQQVMEDEMQVSPPVGPSASLLLGFSVHSTQQTLL